MERKYYLGYGDDKFEVSKKDYIKYYKEVERNRYLNKLAKRKNVSMTFYNENGELMERDFIDTESESVESIVLHKMMLDKLQKVMKKLTADELYIIKLLFTNNLSERQAAEKTNIPRMTLVYKKEKILNKLKFFLEN